MLGAVAEGPTHGFALARRLGPAGDLGRVWTLPRPVVYQALKKLAERRMVAPGATEPGVRGPNRTIVSVTPAGRRALERWLRSPVPHVRDIRSELLLKLALLERAGADAAPLVGAQRQVLAGRLEHLVAQRDAADGFDRVLAAWRIASVGAVMEVLAALHGDRDAERAGAGKAAGRSPAPWGPGP